MTERTRFIDDNVLDEQRPRPLADARGSDCSFPFERGSPIRAATVTERTRAHRRYTSRRTAPRLLIKRGSDCSSHHKYRNRLSLLRHFSTIPGSIQGGKVAFELKPSPGPSNRMVNIP